MRPYYHRDQDITMATRPRTSYIAHSDLVNLLNLVSLAPSRFEQNCWTSTWTLQGKKATLVKANYRCKICLLRHRPTFQARMLMMILGHFDNDMPSDLHHRRRPGIAKIHCSGIKRNVHAYWRYASGEFVDWTEK